MKRIILAVLVSLFSIFALISPAKAAGGPPYYFKWYGNSHWCITDPNDSTTNGTGAVMEVCNVNTPGQGVTFVKYISSTWFIKTDNGMCITNNGGNGNPIVYDACDGNNSTQIWAYETDSNGHNFWVNGPLPNDYAIGLRNSDPFAGAVVQSENPHWPPLPADSDQEWCVTDANNQPLVCS
jgi:hypothetical protein